MSKDRQRKWNGVASRFMLKPDQAIAVIKKAVPFPRHWRECQLQHQEITAWADWVHLLESCQWASGHLVCQSSRTLTSDLFALGTWSICLYFHAQCVLARISRMHSCVCVKRERVVSTYVHAFCKKKNLKIIRKGNKSLLKVTRR